MTKIFISYRRDDSSGHVGRLYDRLVEAFNQQDIFIDIDTIMPGDDFHQAIEGAVAASDVLLAVIGKQWLTVTDEHGNRRLDNPDDFVRLEIVTALNHNLRVIPILVRGAAMPRASELPEALQPLTRRHAHEIGDRDFHYDTNTLIAQLKRLPHATLVEKAAQFVPRPDAETPLYASPDTRRDVTPWRALIISSALSCALPLLGYGLSYNTLYATQSETLAVMGFGFFVILGWAIHGIVTERILYRANMIFRPSQRGFRWFVKTAGMGLAANGLLLRRASPPLRWRWVTLLALLWIISVVAAFRLTMLIEDSIRGQLTTEETNLILSAILGAIIGVFGGLCTGFVVGRVRQKNRWFLIKR